MLIAGERRFTLEDQRSFAELSGDWNPIHLDPHYARRTVAGEAVVHGVHLLIWALEIAATLSPGALPGRIKADFTRFTAIGEKVQLAVQRSAGADLRLSVIGSGAVRSDIAILFDPIDRSADILEISAPVFDPGLTAATVASDWSGEIEGLISAAGPKQAVAAAFPTAAAWIGAERIVALAALTRLVGMVYPGQNSLFSSLDVALSDIPEQSPAIAFRMPAPRHGLIRGRVSGGGIVGRLASLMRQPPRTQPSMAECARLVHPQAFRGSEALVVGGSRGLGELTAKLIGAGGGQVTLTYASGEGEAARVAQEIAEAGGACAILPYRVGEGGAQQLAALSTIPAHVYYFAAPKIARPPASAFFDPDHLARLQDIFVAGFWELVSGVAARRSEAAFFYPSTVYIEDRPAGFGEYAMAKAAGETLCAEINATLSPMQVFARRLPRLATDQTAGILGVDDTDAASTLLPLIREVQAYRTG